MERQRLVNAPTDALGEVGQNIRWNSVVKLQLSRVRVLEDLLQRGLDAYTDLPPDERLFVEDIDSFRRVRDVNHSLAVPHLTNGRIEATENEVQCALERILDVPIHKEDWGGEVNDLYTANLSVNGRRVPTAFLLKGSGLRANTMELKHCGKNGDQVVRLFRSPAELFVVHFVGNIGEAVIEDVLGKVRERRSGSKPCAACFIDGQETARLLLAYGELELRPDQT